MSSQSALVELWEIRDHIRKLKCREASLVAKLEYEAPPPQPMARAEARAGWPVQRLGA